VELGAEKDLLLTTLPYDLLPRHSCIAHPTLKGKGLFISDEGSQGGITVELGAEKDLLLTTLPFDLLPKHSCIAHPTLKGGEGHPNTH
jgi:hypothetical protein